MSFFHKIDVRIWNDAKFRALSHSGKLVFIMLLTHPGMTALGAMRTTPEGLGAELKMNPEAFREAFGEVLRQGSGFAFCGDPCSEPEAPDYSGIARANEKSAQLAKEAADNQLAFSKEQYEFLKPYIQNRLQTGQDVAAQQQADSAKASERVDQQWSQYQTTFQAIEEKMAQEAMG